MAVRLLIDKIARSACTSSKMMKQLGFLVAISSNQILLLRQSSRHLCNISQTTEKTEDCNVSQYPNRNGFILPNKYTGPNPRMCPNPIDDENIMKAARFAVEERNRRTNADLQLVSVIKAATQALGGVVYFLRLEAIDWGEKKTFEVEVWSEARNDGKFNLLLFSLEPTNCVDLAIRQNIMQKRNKIMSQIANQSGGGGLGF